MKKPKCGMIKKETGWISYENLSSFDIPKKVINTIIEILSDEICDTEIDIHGYSTDGEYVEMSVRYKNDTDV